MRYAFLVQIRLNIQVQLALTGILRELVFHDGHHGEVVRLHSDRLFFDLDDQICPREARLEEVGQTLLAAISYYVGYVWNAV